MTKVLSILFTLMTVFSFSLKTAAQVENENNLCPFPEDAKISALQCFHNLDIEGFYTKGTGTAKVGDIKYIYLKLRGDGIPMETKHYRQLPCNTIWNVCTSENLKHRSAEYSECLIDLETLRLGSPRLQENQALCMEVMEKYPTPNELTACVEKLKSTGADIETDHLRQCLKLPIEERAK